MRYSSAFPVAAVLAVLVFCLSGTTKAAVFSPVLENSQMQFVLSVFPSGRYGGIAYAKYLEGTVRLEYNTLFEISPWREVDSARELISLGVNPVNPDTNQIVLYFNYTAPYSVGQGVNYLSISDTPSNTTMLGHTLLGQKGMKVTTDLAEDSNLVNDTTTKEAYFILTPSYPILDVVPSTYPTDYQQNFVFTTAAFTLVFNAPTFSNSDGVESPVSITLVNYTTNAEGARVAATLRGTVSWHRTLSWDPELSILLNTGDNNGAGDGDDNSNLAYVALVALAVVPIVVIGVIAVFVVVFLWRRRLQIRQIEHVATKLSHESIPVQED